MTDPSNTPPAGSAASPGAGDPPPAASAGADATGKAAASSSGGQGEPVRDTGQPAAWQAPDGLPDHLRGKTAEETVAKLYPAYKGARDAMAQKGEVPKDIAGYVMDDADPALKPYVAHLPDDPAYKVIREAALKSQIPVGQFKAFAAEVYKGLIAGNVAGFVDVQAEAAALVPDDAKAMPEAERTALVTARVSNAHAFATGLEQFGFSKRSATFLADGAASAAGVEAIETIRDLVGERAPALGGAAPGGLTDADLDMRVVDPRNRTDKAFAAETDAMMRRRYGD